MSEKQGDEQPGSWGHRVAQEVETAALGLRRVSRAWGARWELRGRRLLATAIVVVVLSMTVVVGIGIGVWMLMQGLAGFLGEVTGRPWVGQVCVGLGTVALALAGAVAIGSEIVRRGEREIRKRLEQ